eukprot:TRINITY_DN1868_c0_g5_i1.p1 TRINITY_DN1868_c0_g5~~TRINITY_DN1868_c0_g5_i1.p1  ORF type:complete len:277 (-),score=14.58 TRINITY_DN1868_c0_g5_i1:95-901(-)
MADSAFLPAGLAAQIEESGICEPFQVALGLSLAALSGLRVFGPIFLLSFYALNHPGELDLAYGWIDSHGFAAAVGSLLLVEILFDKIPCVDHVMHAICFVLAPMGGAFVVRACGGYCGHYNLERAFMIIGALIAFIFHGGRSATRAASSATTAGLANCPVSIFEDILFLTFVYCILAYGVFAFLFAVMAVCAAPCIVFGLFTRCQGTSQPATSRVQPLHYHQPGHYQPQAHYQPLSSGPGYPHGANPAQALQQSHGGYTSIQPTAPAP